MIGTAVGTDIRYRKLSPRPLAQYSTREIQFSGKRAVVRRLPIGWQAYRDLGRVTEQVEYFDTWEEAIRWALESRTDQQPGSALRHVDGSAGQ
jgi:hypothetical protein